MGLSRADRAAPRRIGLFGGSFDPVHEQHLALARAACAALALDEVQLLPAAAPWQRDSLRASPEARIAMLELAVRDEPGLRVNSMEIARGGPTYTVQTLRELGAGDDEARVFFWLMGSDQLVNFTTWHEWQEIARRVELAVAERPGHATEAPPELAAWLAAHGRVLHRVPLAPSDASATRIRERRRAGQPIDGLTPAAVVHYIHTHHLYST